MASNIFERLMVTSYEPYLPDGVQVTILLGCYTRLRIVPSHVRFLSTATIQLSRNARRASLASKEATDVGLFDGPTVLRLLFKYNSDLTMKQVDNTAEDIGYSFEYVINSYVQFRRDAKYNMILPKRTSPMDVSLLRHIDPSG